MQDEAEAEREAASMRRVLRPKVPLTAEEKAEAARVFAPSEATPAQLAERAARVAAVEEAKRRREANDEFMKGLRSPAVDAPFQNRGVNARAEKIFGVGGMRKD